jgi:hypothetical protein
VAGVVVAGAQEASIMLNATNKPTTNVMRFRDIVFLLRYFD